MNNYLKKYIEAKLKDIYSTLKKTDINSVDFLILEQKAELLNEIKIILKSKS